MRKLFLVIDWLLPFDRNLIGEDPSHRFLRWNLNDDIARCDSGFQGGDRLGRLQHLLEHSIFTATNNDFLFHSSVSGELLHFAALQPKAN
jgi:hypothetical protein